MHAVEAGADALGFNGFQGSKRYIDLQKAASWIDQLPPFVTRVAVLVNPSLEEVEAGRNVFDWVQLHGGETPEFCRQIVTRGFRVVKALPVSGPESLENLDSYGCQTFLLDTHQPGVFGGTGRVFDWQLAVLFRKQYPDYHLILSGGLHPGNVSEAVRKVRPWAVDVASGVEDSPGKKSAEKMRQLVAGATA